VIEADGLLSGVDCPDESIRPEQYGLNLVLDEMIVDFMAEYLKPRDLKASKSKSHSDKLRPTNGSDEDDVEMRFPRLPKGGDGGKSRRKDGKDHQMSDDALKRMQQYTTFKESFHGRTFATSPPIAAGSDYKPKPRRYSVESGTP
jgi:hypothetical protein